MSEGKTPPRAGAGGLDALLAAWPSADRGAVEWDDTADRIVARLEVDDAEDTADRQAVGASAAAAAVSDEDLWRAPLPTAPGEVQSSAPIERGSGASMGTTRSQRDRSSFKDLAKLAAMPPSAPASSGVVSGSSRQPSDSGEGRAQGGEREENSGVINLAALQAEEAAQSSKMAAAEPAPGSVAPGSVAPGSRPAASGAMSQATLRSASEPSKGSVPAKAHPAAASTDRRRGGAWIIVSSMVAAAAVAAGVFFGLQQAQRGATVAAANPGAERAAPAKGGAVNAGPAATAAANAAAPQAVTTPIPAEERGVDPFSLPQAGAQAQSAGGPGAVAHATPPAGAKPATAPGAAPTAAPDTESAPAPATVAPPPPAASAVAAATPAATGSANLQDLMQQAAGVTSSPTGAAPTATATDSLPAPGSVPLKPSMGAIQGALGAAMPGARACLGPDDPVSHATVTFKSDGSVQSVAISGGAAGKPAEGCIRAALSKARVQPFVQPTFTAPATVRPN